MRQTPAAMNGSVTRRVSADDIRAIVAAEVEGPVGDDLDLLASGVIDSFGFLELVAAVEESLGIELDFDGLAAEELTVVGPFCRYAAAAAAGGAA